MCYYVTYPISPRVECSVINAENTMNYRYRLGPSPNLRDTNLSNSLEQISNHKRCETIRRSEVPGDFSAKLEAESPVPYRSGRPWKKNAYNKVLCMAPSARARRHVRQGQVRSSLPVHAPPPGETNASTERLPRCLWEMSWMGIISQIAHRRIFQTCLKNIALIRIQWASGHALRN